MSRISAPQTAEPIVDFMVNGHKVSSVGGATVAAAMLHAGIPTRQSVSGEPRIPLCGMGICMECSATVDGVAHVRTCQLEVRPAMNVETK